MEPLCGEEVLRGLAHGLHIVVRNNGHPMGSAQPCIGEMIGSFIDKGSVKGVDTACASAIARVPFAF